MLAPGNYGLDYLASALPQFERFPVVKTSNFIGDTLDMAATAKFEEVLLVGHVGKLCKLAAGVMNTHSHTADGRAEVFCAHAALCGAAHEVCAALMDAATTDACLDILDGAQLRAPVLESILAAIQMHLDRRAGGAFRVGAVLFSNQHGPLGETKNGKGADAGMAELKGTFYGVSIGPGDPELMTLQTVRLIRQCPVLAAPQTASGQMLALDIARSALGEALDGKTIVPLYFAMSRDPAALATSHEKAAVAVRQYLDAGQDVAMLNIGDVSIYATFGYLQEILQAGGYATAMAAGVPSFCAAAARLNVPLTGGMDTPLTIAPGGWTDRVLEMPGTKVLMKAGRQLPVLLDTLQQADKLKKSALVCNCGLPDERVYPDLSLERPQEQAGYFATVLVKE